MVREIYFWHLRGITDSTKPRSSDLHAGQLVDRVGVRLGLPNILIIGGVAVNKYIRTRLTERL
jgi:tRNA A37 threonylcarbamoyltransferase TsaD